MTTTPVRLIERAELKKALADVLRGALPPTTTDESLQVAVNSLFDNIDNGNWAANQIQPGDEGDNRLNILERHMGEVKPLVVDRDGESLLPKPAPRWHLGLVALIATVALIIGYLAWTASVGWHWHGLKENGDSFVSEQYAPEKEGAARVAFCCGSKQKTPYDVPSAKPTATDDFDEPAPTATPAPAPTVAPATRADGREDF